MTGPEHYKAGEAYLDRVMELADRDDPALDTAPILLAIANAHFAAAQAAAVAEAAAYGPTYPESRAAADWRVFINQPKPAKEA